MKIFYHKNFNKRFQKLSKPLKEKTIEAIQRFTKNPLDPILRNHPLAGRMQGKRGFWVTGSYRVVFEEENNYRIVFMLDVGTHQQVYNYT